MIVNDHTKRYSIILENLGEALESKDVNEASIWAKRESVCRLENSTLDGPKDIFGYPSRVLAPGIAPLRNKFIGKYGRYLSSICFSAARTREDIQEVWEGIDNDCK